MKLRNLFFNIVLSICLYITSFIPIIGFAQQTTATTANNIAIADQKHQTAINANSDNIDTCALTYDFAAADLYTHNKNINISNIKTQLQNVAMARDNFVKESAAIDPSIVTVKNGGYRQAGSNNAAFIASLNAYQTRQDTAESHNVAVSRAYADVTNNNASLTNSFKALMDNQNQYLADAELKNKNASDASLYMYAKSSAGTFAGVNTNGASGQSASAQAVFSNLEVLAYVGAAAKKLHCTNHPLSEFSRLKPAGISAEESLPKSYYLFKAASAIYLSAEMNEYSRARRSNQMVQNKCAQNAGDSITGNINEQVCNVDASNPPLKNDLNGNIRPEYTGWKDLVDQQKISKKLPNYNEMCSQFNTQINTIEKAVNLYNQQFASMCLSINPKDSTIQAECNRIVNKILGTIPTSASTGSKPRMRETALEVFRLALAAAMEEQSIKHQKIREYATQIAGYKGILRTISSQIDAAMKKVQIAAIVAALAVAAMAASWGFNAGAYATFAAATGIIILLLGGNIGSIRQLTQKMSEYQKKLNDAHTNLYHAHYYGQLECNQTDAMSEEATFASDMSAVQDKAKSRIDKSLKDLNNLLNPASNAPSSIQEIQKALLPATKPTAMLKDNKKVKNYYSIFVNALFSNSYAAASISGVASGLGIAQDKNSFAFFLTMRNLAWQNQALDVTKIPSSRQPPSASIILPSNSPSALIDTATMDNAVVKRMAEYNAMQAAKKSLLNENRSLYPVLSSFQAHAKNNLANYYKYLKSNFIASYNALKTCQDAVDKCTPDIDSLYHSGTESDPMLTFNLDLTHSDPKVAPHIGCGTFETIKNLTASSVIPDQCPALTTRHVANSHQSISASTRCGTSTATTCGVGTLKTGGFSMVEQLKFQRNNFKTLRDLFFKIESSYQKYSQQVFYGLSKKSPASMQLQAAKNGINNTINTVVPSGKSGVSWDTYYGTPLIDQINALDLLNKTGFPMVETRVPTIETIILAIGRNMGILNTTIGATYSFRNQYQALRRQLAIKTNTDLTGISSVAQTPLKVVCSSGSNMTPDPRCSCESTNSCPKVLIPNFPATNSIATRNSASFSAINPSSPSGAVGILSGAASSAGMNSLDANFLNKLNSKIAADKKKLDANNKTISKNSQSIDKMAGALYSGFSGQVSKSYSAKTGKNLMAMSSSALIQTQDNASQNKNQNAQNGKNDKNAKSKNASQLNNRNKLNTIGSYSNFNTNSSGAFAMPDMFGNNNNNNGNGNSNNIKNDGNSADSDVQSKQIQDMLARKRNAEINKYALHNKKSFGEFSHGVHKNREANLFDIVSTRYRISGYPVLLKSK